MFLGLVGAQDKVEEKRKKERKRKKQINLQTNKGFSFCPKHPVDPEYNKPKHAQPAQAKFLFPC